MIKFMLYGLSMNYYRCFIEIIKVACFKIYEVS